MASLDEIFADLPDKNSPGKSLDEIFADLPDRPPAQAESEPNNNFLGNIAKYTGLNGLIGPKAFTQTGKNIGADFGLGVGQLISGTGSALKWAGADSVGDTLKSIGSQEQQKILDAQDTDGQVNQYGVGSAITQSTPFTLATLPVGLGGGRLAAGLAGKALTRFGVTGKAAEYAIGGAGLAGGTIPPTTFEAMTEAGDAYEKAKAKGATEQDAKSIGLNNFWKNMGLLNATNAAQFAVTFGNPYLRRLLPKMATQGIEKYPKAALFAGVLADGLMEGGEEVAQENFKRGSLGDLSEAKPEWNPTKWDDELNLNFAAGAGMGLIHGTGGHLLNVANNGLNGISKPASLDDIFADIPSKQESQDIGTQQQVEMPQDFNAQLQTFKSAITDIESGGDYNAVGPWIDGDRALGKYQIMQSNWPSWCKEAGLSADAPLTPENQERVADYKFKKYYDMYGGDWGKVAIAWHAGGSRVNLSDEQLAKISDGNMTTLDYRNSVLSKMGNITSNAKMNTANTANTFSSNQYNTASPLEFTPEEQQQAVTWLEERRDTSDNAEEINNIDKQLTEKKPWEILNEYKVTDENGQEVTLGQKLFHEKFQEQQNGEQNNIDISDSSELSPDEQEYIKQVIQREMANSKDTEWKNYLSGVTNGGNATLTDFANNYTVNGTRLVDLANQAGFEHVRQNTNKVQQNVDNARMDIQNINAPNVHPFMSSEQVGQARDLTDILNAIATQKYDQAEQSLSAIPNRTEPVKTQSAVSSPEMISSLNQLTGQQPASIQLPNQPNTSGLQAVQQLKQQTEAAEKPAILPTMDDVMLKRQLMQAIYRDKNFTKAAELADTLNMPKKANLYRQLAVTRPVGGNIRQRITADMIRQSVARDSLTDMENLFVDLLEHYKVSVQEVESQITGQYNGIIKGYIDALRAQAKQPGIKATVDNKSGDLFTRTYSSNFKWYMDLAKQTGYSANKIPNNVLEEALPQIALDHLRNGYVDPKYGEFVTDEMREQFADMEAALNGIRSCNEKISKAVSPEIREPIAGSEGRDRVIQAAEQAIPITRVFGRESKQPKQFQFGGPAEEVKQELSPVQQKQVEGALKSPALKEIAEKVRQGNVKAKERLDRLPEHIRKAIEDREKDNSNQPNQMQQKQTVVQEEPMSYNVREELLLAHPEYQNNKEALQLAERAIQTTLDFEQNAKIESATRVSEGQNTDILRGDPGKVSRRQRTVTRQLGLGVTKKLIHDGVVSLVGGKFTNPGEMATLAQVLRHPGYETFHILFTKGRQSAEIVGHEAVSSRLPGITKAHVGDLPTFIADMHQKMESYGADGYYLVHNHPSGKPNASRADIELTDFMATHIPGFRAHVIINSNQYGVIEKGVRLKPDSKPLGNTLTDTMYDKLFGRDELLSPEINHPALGKVINNVREVANLSKSIQISPDYSTVIYLDSQLKVRGISEVHNDVFKKDNVAARYIRWGARANYSHYTMVITNSEDIYQTSKKLIERGYVLDSYKVNLDSTARSSGTKPQVSTNNEWMGIPETKEPVRLREDITKYSAGHNTPTDSQIEQALHIRFIPDAKLKPNEQALSELGSQMGVPVRFFIAERGFRGFHIDGITYVNRNGDRGIEWAFWHEGLHWMKQQDPELYQDLYDAIKDAFAVSSEQIKAYRKTIKQGELIGKNGEYLLSDEDIIEEMFADEMGDIAKRQQWFNQLAQQDKGLFDRFVDFLKKMLANIKVRIVGSGEDSGFNSKQIKVIENSLRKVLLSLKDAAGQRVMQDRMEFPYRELPGEAVQYSADKEDSVGKIRSVNNFISESIKKKNMHQEMFLRTVSKDEAQRIKDKTGYDVHGYSHYLNSDDLRHILNQHGTGAEKQNDQIPLTTDDLKNIPDILNHPQKITKGNPTKREGLPTVRFIKPDSSGTYVIVEAIHSKDKKLVVKTMWKKIVARHRASNSDPLHTSTSAVNAIPPGGNQTSSINSIVSQGQKDVKSDIKYSADAISSKNDNFIQEKEEQKFAKFKSFLEGKPVVAITGNEFAKSEIPLTKQVSEWFAAKYNGLVHNSEIGDVVLNERGIKDSMAHGFGRKKAAAFATVPDIITNGIVIDEQQNWKRRGYDTYVIAAPVSINNEHHVGTVVVTRSATDMNRFYLHEVYITKELYPSAFKTGASADKTVEPSGADNRVPIRSLLQNIFSVNEDEYDHFRNNTNNSNQTDIISDKVKFSAGAETSSESTNTQKALKRLATKIGVKPSKNVLVVSRPVVDEPGFAGRYLQSVKPLAEKYPKLMPFFRLASGAMEKQERLRNDFRHRLDKVDKLLGSKENKESLFKMLLDGDVNQHNYTTQELKDAGYNSNVIRAYHAIRTAYQHAHKLANEVRQGIETKSENMNGAKLAELQNNKFAEILSVADKGYGQYLVFWKQPKITEHVVTITKSELETLRQDPNVQITKERLETGTTHAMPESSGLTRGDNWYEVEYRSQTPPITNRAGYISHFFHDWFVMAKNGEGAEMLYSARTMREAVQYANKYVKDNPDAEIIVKPKQFRFSGADVNAAIMGDMNYFKLTQKVSDDLEISLDDAREWLNGKVHMKNRHRFVGNFLQRKGANGWEQDLDWVNRHYFNMVSRYVAMDPFKSKSISTFERLFGQYDKEYQGLGEYVKEYINDVNGLPTELENAINNSLNGNKYLNKFLGTFFGERPSLQLAANVTNAVAVLKLGMLNVSSGMLQLTQFINVASAMDSYEHAWQGVAAGIKPSLADKRILAATGVDANLSMETAGYSKAGQMSAAFQWSTILFRYGDLLMRRTAALGAYRKAIERGMSRGQAIEYAKDINRKANFEYGVNDAPNIFRRGGPVSQVLLQFKKYPIKQMELMVDLAKHGNIGQNAKFWVPYLLLSGIWGIPLLSVFKEIFGWFGWDWDDEAKKAMFEWAGNDEYKQALAKTAWYGLLSNTAYGVDVSKRTGIGDAVPTSVKDLTGPVIGTIYQAAKEISRGNGFEAIKVVSPGVGNILVAAAGETHGERGRIKTKYEETYERIQKGLGFMPVGESMANDREWVEKSMKRKIRDEVADAIDDYLEAEANKDTKAKQTAMKELQRLRVSPRQVANERMQKRRTGLQRTEKTIPIKYRSEFNKIQQFE